MAHSVDYTGETVYAVCHDGGDIYHYAVVESGVLKTGQPNIDTFTSEQNAYDKYGEKLPPRYEVIEEQTVDGTTHHIQQIGADTVLGEVVDRVALKQTAYDKYDSLSA